MLAECSAPGWPVLWNTKDSTLTELDVPPSVIKAAPLAAPGDSIVPVGGGSAGGPGETEATRSSPAL